MNCKACNAPLLGDSPEQICNQCKIEELIGENARLQSELSALKTPHTCGECAHFSGLGWSEKGACDALGIFQYHRDTPMLCGHFKAKGQP